MEFKEAIVLAGGLGTRLQGMLPGMPKCMAMVNGKPFLTYVLDYLATQKIHKVILSVGFRKEQIISYFGQSYGDLEIRYAIENEPLGTGGAVKLAFGLCSQDTAFVLNGDTYFQPELEKMQNLHIQSSADITIAAKFLNETRRYGLLLTNTEGRITEFREKEPDSGSGWINGGIYLIHKHVFDNFSEAKFSLENDLFKVSCSNNHLQAFKTEAFFLDMGIPEDYIKAQTMITAPPKA